jgi:hypothetical protein
VKNIVKEQINRVILKYDADDKCAKEYDISLKDVFTSHSIVIHTIFQGDFSVVINLSNWKGTFAAFESKFNTLFNLDVRKAIAALTVQKTTIENTLSVSLHLSAAILTRVTGTGGCEDSCTLRYTIHITCKLP